MKHTTKSCNANILTVNIKFSIIKHVPCLEILNKKFKKGLIHIWILEVR